MRTSKRPETSESLMMQILASEQAQLVSRLGQALYKEGIQPSREITSAVLNFIQLRENFLNFKKVPSKRDSADNLKIRIGTIKRVHHQVKADRGYTDSRAGEEFVDSQLFIALLEKASAITDSFFKSDIRETAAFSFHLWNLRNQLIKQKIKKPVETLSLVLDKSGVLKGVASQWKPSTIHNKCSSIQSLINLSKKYGACHEPKSLGSWPKVHSSIFVGSLANGCEKCRVAWNKTLKVKNVGVVPIDLAYIALGRELPSHNAAMKRLITSAKHSMPLEELLRRTPVGLRAVGAHFFKPL